MKMDILGSLKDENTCNLFKFVYSRLFINLRVNKSLVDRVEAVYELVR
jgi:hypothetical protein